MDSHLRSLFFYNSLTNCAIKYIILTILICLFLLRQVCLKGVIIIKNRTVHFFKFYYSFIIVFYHIAYHLKGGLPGGYMAVEFYLICAGMFLFKSFEKKEHTANLLTPIQYGVKRFSRMFPWALTGFLFVFVVKRLWIDRCFSLTQHADYFSGDIWELLLIKINGMNDNMPLFNGPAWTMGALCIVGLVIWGLLYYDKTRWFRDWIMPVSLIFFYGVWRHLESGDHQVWIGWTTLSVFRTYIGMCLGYYCYKLSAKFSEKQLSALGASIVTIVEISLHVIATIIMFNRETRNYQWLVSLIFVISLVIGMSGKSYLAVIMNKIKFIDFLGDFSLSLYLVHYGVILIFRHSITETLWSGKIIGLYAVAVILVGLIHYYGTLWMEKHLFTGIKRFWNKYCLTSKNS